MDKGKKELPWDGASQKRNSSAKAMAGEIFLKGNYRSREPGDFQRGSQFLAMKCWKNL